MSINYTINVNKVNQNRKKIVLESSDDENLELTRFLEINKIDNLIVTFDIFKEGSIINIEAKVTCSVFQNSSNSDEEIKTDLDFNFKRLLKFQEKHKLKKDLKYIDIETLDEEIDIITNPNILFLEILKEELFLEVNPFIKSK